MRNIFGVLRDFSELICRNLTEAKVKCKGSMENGPIH